MNKPLAGAAASPEPATEKTSYSWDEVRAELDLDEDAVAQHRARLEAEVQAYKLAEVRRRQQVTQHDLAQTLGISQTRVSQIERQSLDDTVLSTLAAYVEALGGQIRVVADFGAEQVVLSRITARTPTNRSVETARPGPRDLTDVLKAKYQAGASLRALAAETGLSRGTVHRLLSESGVVLRSRSSGNRKKQSARTTRVRSDSD